MIGIGDRDRCRSRVSFSSCPPPGGKCDWLTAFAYRTDDRGSGRSYCKLVVAIQHAKLETDDEWTSVKPAISLADEISSDPSLTDLRKLPFVTQPPFRYQPVPCTRCSITRTGALSRTLPTWWQLTSVGRHIEAYWTEQRSPIGLKFAWSEIQHSRSSSAASEFSRTPEIVTRKRPWQAMQFRRAAWSTETPLSWFGLNARNLGKCSSAQKGGRRAARLARFKR